MAEVLDWRRSNDLRPIVQRSVQALLEGQLVAFPADTVYGIAASALHTAAVDRLAQLRQQAEGPALTLALPSAAHALDWVAPMSPLGWRLARRCWPGPVTLVFRDRGSETLAGRLPESVRQQLCPEQGLPVCVPDHDALAQALQLLPVPLVLASAARNGEAGAATADEVVQTFGREVDLVIDDGASRYGQGATVVQVDGRRWEVLREGVVPAVEVERQTTCLIVFVCTGNTCRSPLAEALCKKRLAERLGCSVEELPQRGYLVLSAGMAAMMGDVAAPEAVEVARQLGADLSNHASRPLTPDLAAQADHLIAMTCGHLALLAGRYPNLGCRPRLLSSDGQDVADPIGGEQPVYEECAQQIIQYLEALLPEIEAS